MNTKKLEEEIIEEANKYVVKGAIPFLPIEGYFKYLSEGDRLIFENHYFDRRRQLAALGMAYWLKKEKAVKELLEQLIWEICNEYTWALPAHLPIVSGMYSGESPEWLDLFAAETGQALSELIEIVGEDLSPMIRQRIFTEVNRRIFEPLENRNWEWELKENNWSSVIGGAIGLSVLSLLPKNDSRQKQLIERLDIAMQSYLRGFGSDGACVEGVGYWAYGFGYFIYYAQKLAEVTGDTTYLELAKVKKIAEFPYYTMITPGIYVPFSDYSKVELPTGLVSFCHDYFQVSVPSMKEVNAFDSDHCYRFAHIYRNLIWNQPLIYRTKNQETNQWFEDVQWWIKNNELSYFAVKGGDNAESHNHLDVGHFIFGTKEQLFLTDLGAGEYTKDYFSESSRYHIFPNSAQSHSVPQINGAWQQPGSVGSRLLEKDTVSAKLDLSDIYLNARLNEYHRNYSIIGQKVTIKDTFDFTKEKNQVIENFITQIRPEVSGKVVYLKEEGQICKLDLGTTRIETKEHLFSNHHGQCEKAYTIEAGYELGQKGSVEMFFEIVNDTKINH